MIHSSRYETCNLFPLSRINDCVSLPTDREPNSLFPHVSSCPLRAKLRLRRRKLSGRGKLPRRSLTRCANSFRASSQSQRESHASTPDSRNNGRRLSAARLVPSTRPNFCPLQKDSPLHPLTTTPFPAKKRRTDVLKWQKDLRSRA